VKPAQQSEAAGYQPSSAKLFVYAKLAEVSESEGPAIHENVTNRPTSHADNFSIRHGARDKDPALHSGDGAALPKFRLTLKRNGDTAGDSLAPEQPADGGIICGLGKTDAELHHHPAAPANAFCITGAAGNWNGPLCSALTKGAV
jgi:hypothetical protein